jgi:hypothetical protein
MMDMHREVLFYSFQDAHPELFIFCGGSCLILKTIMKVMLYKTVQLHLYVRILI